MIQIKNLTAGYQGKAVVKEISLDFVPGEVLVLLGPNGSGKSTLLKAALGLIPAMSGEILYDETEIRRLPRKEIARKAAFLTQSRSTPSIQALKMVLHGRFPYLSYPRRYGRGDYAIARSAMDTTECRQYENTNVTELSGGQKQSVYVAMALAQDTQTVFMDEPTTYLDIRRQFQIMNTARSLAEQGKAVVLVLHDLPMAMQCADRIAVFREGELLAWDTPGAIYRSRVLERAFGVRVCWAETSHGRQYYCIPKED